VRKREPACLHPAHPRIFVCVCLCVREYVQADEKRAANLQHAPARREEQILKNQHLGCCIEYSRATTFEN
jgi:hypothetical protein